jgi:hypothetical protein
MHVKQEMQHTAVILTVFALFSAIFPFTSCNKDGIGIFYMAATEVKQNSSAISELPIQQVVEDGGTVYIRTGLSVWRGSSSGSWSKIRNGKVGSIAPLNGGGIAAVLINDADNPTASKILTYSGGTWASAAGFAYSNDSHIVADGAGYYISEITDKATGGNTYSIYISPDLSTSYGPVAGEGEAVIGASATAAFTDAFYVITKGSVYGDTTIADASFKDTTPSISASGNFSAVAYGSNDDPEDFLMVGTDDGEIFYCDATTETWTKAGEVDEAVLSMDVIQDIDGGSDDYLIVGVEDGGYYEVNMNGWSISAPNATADASGASEFAAKYPDLAYSSVMDVEADSTTAGVFYLATAGDDRSRGLWKRNTDGSFEKL